MFPTVAVRRLELQTEVINPLLSALYEMQQTHAKKGHHPILLEIKIGLILVYMLRKLNDQDFYFDDVMIMYLDNDENSYKERMHIAEEIEESIKYIWGFTHTHMNIIKFLKND